MKVNGIPYAPLPCFRMARLRSRLRKALGYLFLRALNGGQYEATLGYLTRLRVAGAAAEERHVTLMEECRRYGSKLVLGLNSDASVQRLKGAEAGWS